MTNPTQPPERARAIEMLAERYETGHVLQNWLVLGHGHYNPVVLEAMLAFRSEGIREAVEAAYSEGLVEQATRLGIIPNPGETPGQHRDRTRKAAILATLSSGDV